jgi:hypothetical protein
MSDFLAGLFRCGAGFLGAVFIFAFFKSIIRVGVLNQHYQDPIAFWTGRIIFQLFRVRIALQPGSRERKNEIMTWFWPCMLIGIITTWFLLVTFGFALLNFAFAAEKTFLSAIVASGSALSTLGFSTPPTITGQILAILEGAIGLFLIVYLFTFLPGFMDLIRERGNRVAWIYHRTAGQPAGVTLLVWMARNSRLNDLAALWEEWAGFFHTLANSRSFLPVLCIVRPLTPDHSWVCAFAAFLDALALVNTTVEGATEHSQICFQNGVNAFRNTHQAMRGTPISPTRDPALMHVKRSEHEAACALLEAAGVPLVKDRESAWQRFVEAHMLYEEEVAWLAAAISDPVPSWPSQSGVGGSNL